MHDGLFTDIHTGSCELSSVRGDDAETVSGKTSGSLQSKVRFGLGMFGLTDVSPNINYGFVVGRSVLCIPSFIASPHQGQESVGASHEARISSWHLENPSRRPHLPCRATVLQTLKLEMRSPSPRSTARRFWQVQLLPHAWCTGSGWIMRKRRAARNGMAPCLSLPCSRSCSERRAVSTGPAFLAVSNGPQSQLRYCLMV